MALLECEPGSPGFSLPGSRASPRSLVNEAPQYSLWRGPTRRERRAYDKITEQSHHHASATTPGHSGEGAIVTMGARPLDGTRSVPATLIPAQTSSTFTSRRKR